MYVRKAAYRHARASTPQRSDQSRTTASATAQNGFKPRSKEEASVIEILAVTLSPSSTLKESPKGKVATRPERPQKNDVSFSNDVLSPNVFFVGNEQCRIVSPVTRSLRLISKTTPPHAKSCFKWNGGYKWNCGYKWHHGNFS